MSAPTAPSRELRSLLAAHRSEFDALLTRYRVTNPKLFGSVAGGMPMRAVTSTSSSTWIRPTGIC